MKLPTYEDQGGYRNPNNGGARLQNAPQVDVSGNDFGARNWAEVGKLGQQIQRAAGQVGHIYDDYNTTKANEAANTFQREFLAWQSEASQKKGKFGQDVGTEYAQWSQKRLEALGKDLNNVQKGRFMGMAQDSMATQQRWAADYGNGEKKNYQIAELQAGIDVHGQTGKANMGNPEMVAKSIAIQKSLAFELAQMKGLGEEATILLMQEGPQTFLSEGIENVIRSGDTGTASGMLEQYATEIGAGNVGKLQALLKSERKRQVAEAKAEARAAMYAAKEAAAEAERGIINQNVGTIISGMDKLPTLSEQRDYAYTVANMEEDPKRRDDIISRVEKELSWRTNKEKATISRQVYEFQELSQTNGWTPQQAEEKLALAKNLLPQAREQLSKDYDGKAQTATPENKMASLTLKKMIDLGSERGGIDKRDTTSIDAFAYENGLTFNQTQAAHLYAENNGAAGMVTQTQVDKAWKLLNPNSKRVPADMLELVQNQLAPGKPVTNEQIRKIMSRLVADGETADAGFISFGAGKDESYADALRNDRGDKWKASVPKKDAERIKGKLDLAGIRATPERIEEYYWDELGGE